jgi:cyclopropane-fatty-acyl-phospholipid synthase
MSPSIATDKPSERVAGPRSLLAGFLRKPLLSALAGLREGQIVVLEGEDRRSLGDAASDLRATIRVANPRFWTAVALGGSIGAAEAWTRGYWTADDLTTVIRILARNRDASTGLEDGLARVRGIVEQARAALFLNSRSRSRSNIAAHYDLGNEFFESFLDETMTYSCAVFESDDHTLADASRHKYDLVCRKLGLGPGREVLEIGTGWGGFALHAAGSYGCRVTTTTISPKQHAYSVKRIREAGLAHLVKVERIDYRDLPVRLGRRFDHLVSIEMIEAVGHRYLDTYFRTCDELLEPGGSMLLQAIVIDDRLYDEYRRGVDFIQKYVFPGGCLPSISAIRGSVDRATDLRIEDVHDITPHYAETLRRWRDNFRANRERIAELGFNEEFRRLWEFYFCYCEGGFLERTIGDVQIALRKSTGREARSERTASS